MIVGGMLFLFSLLLLIYMANRYGGEQRQELVWCIAGAFVARILMMWLGSEFPWFSGGVEGDWTGYERVSVLVARMWQRDSLFYVTSDHIAGLGHVSLPMNIFGFIFFLNGGESTRLGGASVVALVACLTGLNFYLLAKELKMSSKQALTMTAGLMFLPSIFLYTSHMYKDGFVLALCFGTVAAAVRLSKKFSALQVVICLSCLALLWLVRHYLMFAAAIPVAIGIIGVGSKSFVRPALMMLAAFFAVVVIGSYTDVFDTLGNEAQRTFENGTARNVVESNMAGGSGIDFDDNDDPWSQLPLKLAYTLFAPFVWGAGSLAFQLGKLDGLFMTFALWRIARYLPRLWRNEPTVTAMLLAFVLPMSIAYATGVSNVGLIVRQRMPLTISIAFLALLTYRKQQVPQAQAREASPRVRRIPIVRPPVQRPISAP